MKKFSALGISFVLLMSMFVITTPAKACHFSLKIEKMGPSEVIVNKEFTYKIVVHNGLWEGYIGGQEM